MKTSKLPPIQGKRFDLERLQFDAVGLVSQANIGPTYIRQSGRVSHVVMTEELFDRLWPDPQRVWSIDEMPLRIDQLLEQGLKEAMSKQSDE